MELKDTIEMMNSSNYAERFKAEYFQLKIRMEKLENLLHRWDNGQLDFEPDSNKDTLTIQLKIMKVYLSILESRASQENIELC